MTFQANASQIRVTAPDGRVFFDTNEGLFHATDLIVGSVNIAQLNPGDQRDTTTNLSAIDTNANFVRGAAKISSTGYPSGAPPGGWFNVGGTYLHLYSSGGASNSSIRPFIAPTDVWSFTFSASGGFLKLTEFALNSDRLVSGVSLTTYAGFTLNYRIYAGLFT